MPCILRVLRLAALALILFQSVNAKTLFVIADLEADPVPIKAYGIQGDTLVLQKISYIPKREGGAIDLDVDEKSKIIFVTYENAGVVQLIDAETMTDLSYTEVPSANDLSGIVVDEAKEKVYALDRLTNDLYVYDWNSDDKTLALDTLIELENVGYGFGIDLDDERNILYVSDMTDSVKAFNTNSWALESEIVVGRDAIGIAVDAKRNYLYTSAGGELGGDYSLGRFNLNSDVEDLVKDMRSPVIGIAVEYETGQIYVTTFRSGADSTQSRLIALDMNMNRTWKSPEDSLRKPTGLCVPSFEVGYNPLNLTKDDGFNDGETSAAGDTITYKICFDDEKIGAGATSVSIYDQLPDCLQYISSTGGGFYDTNNHTVTWNLSAIPPGQSETCFQLETSLKSATPCGTHFSNVCMIKSDEYEKTQISEYSAVDACELVIISPNGSENWQTGMIEKIKWTSGTFTYIDIYYSTDEGSSWLEIAKNADASKGSYDWTIPNTPTEKALVKISLSSDETVADQSDEIFSIDEQPELTLVKPNGFYKWQSGSKQKIIWTAGASENVKIDLSTNSGATWRNIVASYPADSGEYEWTVPETPSDKCVVRVADSDSPEIKDESDKYFTIANMRITDPDEQCCAIFACEPYEIKWEANYCGLLAIYYSSSADGPWTELSSDVFPGDGSAEITLPANLGASEVFVKVADQLWEVSDISKTEYVSPLISVGEPRDSAYVKAGSKFIVKWSSSNISSVKIEFSSDGGGEWQTVATNIPAFTNKYEWTAPNVESDRCMIRVSGGGEDCRISDIAGPFYVSADGVELVSPNGAEIWSYCETRRISWKATNVDSIEIAYRTVENGAWIPIDVVAGATGRYDWRTPKTPTQFAQIQIKDINNDKLIDRSDSLFTIAGLALDYPTDNGVKLLVGSTAEIKWKSAEVDKIRIQYSTDAGASWSLLAYDYPAAAGKYSWTVPNLPSDYCQVRIVDQKNSCLADTSAHLFTIKGILLLSPEAGDALIVGNTEKIIWESANIPDAKIEFSSDGGDSWVTLISSAPSTGAPNSYDWLLPNTPSAQCFVKISSADDESVYDVNSAPFSISGEGVLLSSPNIGENWTIGSTREITWLSRNVVTVNVDYSIDGGKSWTRIASAIPASHKKIEWKAPHTPTTEFRVKVSDADNPAIFDVSDANNRISGANVCYPPPSTWKIESQTGKSSSIIIPKSISPRSLGHRNIQECDAIGVFYEHGGEMICAGSATWNNQNISITVWGNNARTPLKDGFETNETYKFKIWDAEEGKELRAWADYDETTSYYTNYFFDGNISILEALRGYTILSINLPAGKWSLISSNLLPYDSDIEYIARDIKSALDMMKNDSGEVYIPETANYVNSIENWDIKDGYQIYMMSDDVLEIEGIYIDPSKYARTLEAKKWYIVSYLPENAKPISEALASIGAASPNDSLLIVKNSLGKIYFPDYNIDQIGQMRPGEGYQIVVKRRSTLDYSKTSRVKTNSKKQSAAWSETEPRPLKYVPGGEPTGNNATLIATAPDIEDFDEIGVYDENENLIGGGVFVDGRAAISVWGDNTATDDKIEGALAHERLSIRIWSREEYREYFADVENIRDLLTEQSGDGDIRYRRDGLWSVDIKKGMPHSTLLFEDTGIKIGVIPNPSNGSMRFKFDLPEAGFAELTIYNSIGEKVATVLSENRAAGAGTAEFNCSACESGAYYYRIQSGEQSRAGKIIILK